MQLLNEESNSTENNYMSDSDDAESFPVPDEQATSSDHEEIKKHQDDPFESKAKQSPKTRLTKKRTPKMKEIPAPDNRSNQSQISLPKNTKPSGLGYPEFNDDTWLGIFFRQRSVSHKDTEMLSIRSK